MVADSPSLFQRLRQRVGLARAKEASVEERSTLVTRAKRLRTPDRHRKRSAHPQRRATLSVPSELLVRPFSADADYGPSRQQIDELSTLVRLQLQHELHESSLWLVDSFDILAGEGDTDGSARLGLIAEGSSALPLSDRVIDGLCALMQRANYRLLSQDEWEFALSENFMFTLPVSVTWDHFDSATISRLFVRHPHLGLRAAQLARRVLVFHRGAGVETKRAFFFEEKLDMLLDKLFTDPCRMCYRLFCGGSRAPSAPSFKESKSSRQRHGERINLERLLPSLHRLLRRFFFRLTVQEPTFSEVVVVYAEVVPNEPPRLCLKSFRDIPMADIEVVFPGVTVERLKSADIVKLAVILAAGVATAVYGFLFSQAVDWTVRATLLGLLALRGFQTWRSVIAAKGLMDDFIRTTLYHRSQDSQKGVLLYVINSIEQHEQRECLLLYLLLLRDNTPEADASSGDLLEDATLAPPPPPQPAGTSADELQASFKRFLHEEFGVGVHVDVGTALGRLERLGLVTADPERAVFTPAPIENAIAILRRTWGLTRAHSADSSPEGRTASSIGGSSTSGSVCSSRPRATPQLLELTTPLFNRAREPSGASPLAPRRCEESPRACGLDRV